MTQIVSRGDSVYGCDTCNRRIRVPTNRRGLDVVQRCTITSGCQGKLHRITTTKEINNTPAFPPEVEGLQDWFARSVMYTHYQPVRTASWTIVHNLQNFPVFYAFVERIVDGTSTLVEAEPSSITTVDANTTIVTFTNAESGQIQCVAYASKNNTNFNATSSVSTEQNTIQVSSDACELTIATLDTSTNITLDIKYIATNTVDVAYTVDDVTSVNSAWVGVSQVVINGRRYTTRSFNVRTAPSAIGYFTSGAIVDGATFYFDKLNGVDINPGEMMILLSNSPHSKVDCVYDRYIDATAVSKILPELAYTSGRCYAASSIVKSTYPLILVV